MRAWIAALVVVALGALPAPAPAGTGGSPDPGIHWESYLPDMPPANGPQPHAVPGCRTPTVRCIDTEIRNLRARQKQFGCDHRGVFATTYLELTRQLRDTLRTRPDLFVDKRYLYTEDALFADIYLNTLRSYARGKPVPQAWQIALDAAQSPDLNAAQDMLLGINAHVQNDMPFLIAALGMTRRNGASRKPDHDAVNEVLAAAYDRVVTAVRDRFDPFMQYTNGDWDPADDIAGLEMVREWRENVWRNAERLVEAKTAADRAQVADQIHQYAGGWAQAIATKAMPGYGTTRDAYCASKLGKPPKTVAMRQT
jgi:hypothetical protein